MNTRRLDCGTPCMKYGRRPPLLDQYSRYQRFVYKKYRLFEATNYSSCSQKISAIFFYQYRIQPRGVIEISPFFLLHHLYCITCTASPVLHHLSCITLPAWVLVKHHPSSSQTVLFRVSLPSLDGQRIFCSG